MLTMREKMLRMLREGCTEEALFVLYQDIVTPMEEVWKLVGRDRLGILHWAWAHKLVSRRCSIETARIREGGLDGEVSILTTPAGTLTEKKLYDPVLKSAATREHFVKETTDYEILLSYLNDITVELNPEYNEIVRGLGDGGLPLVWLGRTPFQQMWIQWASLLDFSLHLADAPDLVGSVMQRMGCLLMEVVNFVAERVSHSEISLVDIPDNITAPAIGRSNFETYCMPYYHQIVEIFKPLGISVVAHMDGDLKPLWPLIGKTGINGIDSFSPPPDNDTAVKDAVALWPQIALLVNFPSSVHLMNEQTVYETAARILEEGMPNGRMWIQVSENIPPGVWRVSFPQILRAIDDYNAGFR